MNVDPEKVHKAGEQVLAVKDEIAQDQVAPAMRAASDKLKGLSLSSGLFALTGDYEQFKDRAVGELEYLGYGVISVASKYGVTEEQTKATFTDTDIPR